MSFYSTFTHFRATDTQSYSTVADDDSGAVVFTLFQTFSVFTGAFDYTGSVDFLYNRFDLGLVRNSFQLQNLSIVPKLAFTYVHTRQAASENIFVEEITDIIVRRAKDVYNGYGGTIGFDTDYSFCGDSGFSIYSSLGLTGLWGTYSLDFERVTTDSVTLDIASTAELRPTLWVGRWLSDIQVGIQYQGSFCGCFDIAARLGWEFLYLPDEMNFVRINDPSAMKISGLIAGLAIAF